MHDKCVINTGIKVSHQ